MEQLTLSPAGPGPRRAPLPPESPLEMPEQSLGAYDRERRRRLRGEAPVRSPALGLVPDRAPAHGLLVHQMWLVLSVGELTGVEKVMLGLFVINIAWISFGALSPLIGFFLGPDPRRRRRRRPLAAPHRAADADLQRGSGAHPRRGLRDAARDRRPAARGEAFDLFLLSDTTNADVWLDEQAMVDAARADPVIGRRIFYRHRAPQPAPQGRQHRRLGRALGRRLSLHARASTPTA